MDETEKPSEIEKLRELAKLQGVQCSSCYYWMPCSNLCYRADLFTEYGVDTLCMGPDDFCSKWRAK